VAAAAAASRYRHRVSNKSGSGISIIIDGETSSKLAKMAWLASHQSVAAEK